MPPKLCELAHYCIVCFPLNDKGQCKFRFLSDNQLQVYHRNKTCSFYKIEKKSYLSKLMSRLEALEATFLEQLLQDLKLLNGVMTIHDMLNAHYAAHENHSITYDSTTSQFYNPCFSRLMQIFITLSSSTLPFVGNLQVHPRRTQLAELTTKLDAWRSQHPLPAIQADDDDGEATQASYRDDGDGFPNADNDRDSNGSQHSGSTTPSIPMSSSSATAAHGLHHACFLFIFI